MAKAFKDSAGGAIKNNLDYFKFNEGVNKFRMVGELLPRYCYWKQLKTNSIPVECLSFDRDEERFTNSEKDWFKHYFPKIESGANAGKDMFPQWSYAIQVIDLADGKLKMMGLKKKMFEQVMVMAAKEAFGDPTDPVTGWDIVVNRNKTGPHAFNVEYVLDQLECKVRSLTDVELETISEMKSIDTLIPRPTVEQQKAFIETAWINEETETNVDKAAQDAFDDDIPF